MLKKLTSPKAKAAHGSSDAHRATTDKELSGLAAIPDDGELKVKSDARASKAVSEKPSTGAAAGHAAATPTDQKQKNRAKTKKARDKLSLDLGALGEAAATEDGGTLQTDERLAKEKDGSTDRRKTLMRSPRTKNILDDHDVSAGGGAKPTSQGQKDAKPKASAAKEPPPSIPAKEAKSSTSTKKSGLSGLKALKSSRKSKKEGHESGNEKEIPASGSARGGGEDKLATSSSKEAKLKGRKNAEDKSESKRVDEQDKDDELPANDKKKDRDDPQRNRELNQKSKSSLSPLRRRKPAPAESDESTGRSSNQHFLGHQMKLRGLPPANQPEVHIIGEITNGESFGNGGFACKWGVEYGSLWHHIAGDQLGQTQTDYPLSSSDPIVWSHPIDLHFATTSFSGWPKLLLQVWQTDTHMKTNVVGYGFMNLPFSPGEHRLTASLWRPMGSAKEELEAKLLGRTQELVSEDVVYNSAWADRCRLQTTVTGKVHVQVGIILRNFHMSELAM